MTVPQVIMVKPPMHLLESTPVPDCSWCETNGDFWECYLETAKALESSNDDKAAAKTAIEQQEGK